MLEVLIRQLRLRAGEGRLLAAMGGFLFLTAAAETFLSGVRNALFLDVFEPERIPEVMIVAAIVSAMAAVAFASIMEHFSRRTMAVGLMVVLSVGFLASFLAFKQNDQSAFAIYVGVAAAEVLLLTHAWDYMGDLVTGRQAKRLLPLAGGVASIAIVVAGLTLGPLAVAVSTEGILLLSALLITGSLGFLWMVPEPERPELEESQPVTGGAIRSFTARATRGFGRLWSHPLLRLLAGATILLVLMSTLIDVQWKIAVQTHYEGAEIARIFGLLEAAIGVGALTLQLLSARVLFPRLGISGANLLQAGSVALLAVGFAVFGTLLAIASLRFLDEALGEAIEKPAQQVTLIPFPPRTKNAAFATLDGVLRPLAQAGGALLALFLLTRFPNSPPWVTAGIGAASFLVLTGHRRRYLSTLEEALSRHLLNLRALGAGLLSVDKDMLQVVDRFLEDEDPMVVVFALSLLRDLSARETATRALPILRHPTPDVRKAAVTVLGSLQEDPGRNVHRHLAARLKEEEDPEVLGALLVAMASLGHSFAETDLGPFIEHPEPAVRRAALTAMARWHPEAVRETLQRLLESGGRREREAALAVVGALGYENFLPAVASAVLEDELRTAALSALSSFGATALPAIDRLLGRRDLPLPVRRTLVTTLAGIEEPEAREMLLQLVGHQTLGPAALTSLRRLRSSGAMRPVEPKTLRDLLRAEVERGARYALLGAALATQYDDYELGFVVEEMEELRIRHVRRVFSLLTLCYHNPEGLAQAETAILSGDQRRQSNGLEYLEGRLEPADATVVVPLAEWDPGEALAPLWELTPEAPRCIESPLEVLAGDDRWWPRALSRYAGNIISGGEAMIPLIEKVMLLKGSELFRGFPGDELAGVAEIASEQHAEKGELIFEQGDVGDAYYLVVQGAVSILRDGLEIAVLGPREGFGEMAILDHDTRSASVQAAEPTTLLVIDRDSFDQMVERNPAIARGIYRVLTQRLRSTLARVAGGN
jgi:HEAT repeat protein/MFS family permease